MVWFIQIVIFHNKNIKGNVIIKDGYGSSGNGGKSADDKLDELEQAEKDN